MKEGLYNGLLGLNVCVGYVFGGLFFLVILIGWFEVRIFFVKVMTPQSYRPPL